MTFFNEYSILVAQLPCNLQLQQIKSIKLPATRSIPHTLADKSRSPNFFPFHFSHVKIHFSSSLFLYFTFSLLVKEKNKSITL